MPDMTADSSATVADPTSAVRKRPKRGERREQILQTLASMLEQPGAERVTTAGLAARLEVSEAALYRHFASKAQMFEGLIDFIESAAFSLVRQISETAQEADNEPAAASRKAARIVAMLLQFAEKNPGMARVMVGDALVFENERLHQRMSLFFDKIESELRQTLRLASAHNGSAAPTADANLTASLLTAFLVGRMQRFTRSGFKKLPTEQLDGCLQRLL